jgi:CBS domain-containing protein
LDSSLTRFLVRPDQTLEEALAVIEGNGHRSVVVVDGRGAVVGTLSDGDARKAILEHRLLSTPVERVMNVNFKALEPARASEAAAIFEQEHIFLIPVVDEHGKLVDLLTAYP